MKVAVTTPTGNVGRRLVGHLIRAGITPILLARDAGRLPDDVRQASEVRELDQGDEAAIVDATRDLDAIYWVDPPTEDDDPVAGYVRMGRSIARAVRDNRIPRVVFQSSVGAEARGGFGEIDGLARTEEMLDEVASAVTHLRCGYFFSNLLMNADDIKQGALVTPWPVAQRLSWVAPEDIAVAGMSRLLSSDWSGRVVRGVYGPQDLSFADVAGIIEAVVGRPVVAQQVSDDEVAAELRGFGLTQAQIDGILGMSQGFRKGFAPEIPRSIHSTTPTTLRSWVVDELLPVL